MTSPQHGGPRPVVTVIQSSPDVPLDRFEPALGDVELRIVAAFAGGSVPTADEVGDGLIVLGGQMSAYDDATAGWLPELRALLAEASTRGVPTLGICLGAQLLAVARGGRVQVAAPPGREAGIVDVHWRPEAAGDPVVGGVAALADARSDTPLPSMHADAVVDLPRGAVWLASSPMYPYQAFRIGSAWGVQFHPEAGADTLGRWADGHDDVDTGAVRAAYDARGAGIAAAGRALAESFVAHVRATAETPEAVTV
ncbi:type 1 glutamine amidotransferase [Cellulomonas fengjieae]|uniref:type 1 glutamine amidotransferase n=1 Tax=Cellulomonas fengjieae TaxID=2819978 RepID=UPI001AAF286D|nr:type 1 glutamine amidotransferase [Cellulomonas fengjieae]MBO3100712.1 type 1 glutamine amidotransferase [Cellulomonas fengjieae]